MEEWLEIEDYPGYFVSNQGNLRGVRWPDRNMKLTKNKTTNYRQVSCGRDTKFDVHRLVANAFCENPNNYNVVDHINHIRDDNRAENLRWVTQSENVVNTTIKPKNITMDHNGYIVEIMRNKKKHRAWFKTIAEAEAHRDAYLATLPY